VATELSGVSLCLCLRNGYRTVLPCYYGENLRREGLSEGAERLKGAKMRKREEVANERGEKKKLKTVTFMGKVRRRPQGEVSGVAFSPQELKGVGVRRKRKRGNANDFTNPPEGGKVVSIKESWARCRAVKNKSKKKERGGGEEIRKTQMTEFHHP